jgi:hypothetical protein
VWRRAFGISVAIELVIAATVLVAASVSSPAAASSPSGQVPVGATPVVLNQPADPFLGKITPSAGADVTGMYAPQVAWPLIGLHMVLLPNGHVVSYGTPVGVAQQGGMAYDDWSPALGSAASAHTQAASMHDYNSFCNALQVLPDGRVLMVGGNSTMNTMIYDPATGGQTMGQNLARQRWYASVLRLPDDRMLVLGGGNYYNTKAYLNPGDNSGVATTPEIGTGTGAWTSLTGADSAVAFGAKDNRWWYPRGYIAPDGTVFGVSYDQMWRLNPAGTGSITALGTLPKAIGVSGSSVMYAPGKILFAGGGQRFNETSEAATNAATTVDINGAAPVVAATAPMAYPRNWLNLTLLPTGEVFANGGTKIGTQAGAANSVYQSEIWNPGTGQWRAGATAQRIRTYHSTALLMPSGAVLTAAGGVPGPEDNLNAEMYYPAYLFTRNTDGSVGWASRPRITSISGSLSYGGNVTLGLGDGRQLASVSLTRAASVTHSFNADQRRVPLTFQQSGSSAEVAMPADANHLPPGSYLLSGVDTNGVPTPSQIVTIKSDGSAGTVTVLEKDQSAGPGTPGGETGPGVVPLTPGTNVGLEPAGLTGYRVRHYNFTGRVDPIGEASPLLARRDSSFVVRKGLADPSCVSFESINYPGRYFRHRNYTIYLDARDNSALFDKDATFCQVTGLNGQNVSFRSVNFPGRYLRQRGGRLYLYQFDGSDVMRQDTTFAVRPALAGT